MSTSGHFRMYTFDVSHAILYGCFLCDWGLGILHAIQSIPLLVKQGTKNLDIHPAIVILERQSASIVFWLNMQPIREPQSLTKNFFWFYARFDNVKKAIGGHLLSKDLKPYMANGQLDENLCMVNTKTSDITNGESLWFNSTVAFYIYIYIYSRSYEHSFRKAVKTSLQKVSVCCVTIVWVGELPAAGELKPFLMLYPDIL